MSANDEQEQFWGGIGGAAWVDLQEQMDVQLSLLGEAVVGAARPEPGERVLDVGCGCGSTTLAIARLVGPAGSVVGYDISEPMLARAMQRASDSGVRNASFTVADAQTAQLAGPFDVVCSRFGVMFFDDPVAAFANLRRATRSGGRLAFVCWQPESLNESFSVVGAAANDVLGPPQYADPTAPGPFAFADSERVRSILHDAGWGSLEIAECRRATHVFGTTDLDEGVNVALRIGPTARRAVGQPADVAERLRSSVRAALESRWTPYGWAAEAACWLVTARN